MFLCKHILYKSLQVITSHYKSLQVITSHYKSLQVITGLQETVELINQSRCQWLVWWQADTKAPKGTDGCWYGHLTSKRKYTC